MKVLIPAAGLGSRFQKEYDIIKPLIPINGIPMIYHVVKGLGISSFEDFIFIIQQEHCDQYKFDKVLDELFPECTTIVIDGLTEGQLSTALLAEHQIDFHSLLICNCDVNPNWDFHDFRRFVSWNKGVNGVVVTTNTTNPAFSFCKVDEDDIIIETAEKNPISNHGNVGVFYFSNGRDFIKYGNEVIKKNIRINNEFYISSVFNEGIKDRQQYMIYEIDSSLSFGTPEELMQSLEQMK